MITSLTKKLKTNTHISMKLKDFLERFIEKNTVIRLWYKTIGGHTLVATDIDEVSMEWEILSHKGIYQSFLYNGVIGVTGIVVSGRFTEAVNIVIEEGFAITNDE